MNVAKATDTTLFPKLCFWTAPGIIWVLTPVLTLSTLSVVPTEVVVSFIILLPEVYTFSVFEILPVSVLTPVQVSFQLFQIVPRFKSNTPFDARFVNVSYILGSLMVISGWTSVSIHSSLSGVNTKFPM